MGSRSSDPGSVRVQEERAAAASAAGDAELVAIPAWALSMHPAVRIALMQSTIRQTIPANFPIRAGIPAGVVISLFSPVLP
jgi:hypothetical protein